MTREEIIDFCDMKAQLEPEIELVIKITEEEYKHIMEMQFCGTGSGKGLLNKILYAIRTGTPLPKGHGNIKDEDEIYELLNSINGTAELDEAFGAVEQANTIIEADEADELPNWFGKNCKDCGNKKCKELGKLPRGYDCSLWQPKVENCSIKMVTNAKEAETYPISEDTKDIEEINKLISKNGQAESEG